MPLVLGPFNYIISLLLYYQPVYGFMDFLHSFIFLKFSNSWFPGFGLIHLGYIRFSQKLAGVLGSEETLPWARRCNKPHSAVCIVLLSELVFWNTWLQQYHSFLWESPGLRDSSKLNPAKAPTVPGCIYLLSLCWALYACIFLAIPFPSVPHGTEKLKGKGRRMKTVENKGLVKEDISPP